MRAQDSRRNARIVLLGWYGSDNTGDEALLLAVAQALHTRGYRDLHVLSTSPAKTMDRLRHLGVRSSPRNPFNPKTIRAMLGARALVLGGGGLIQDGTSVYNLPIYALFVAIARVFRLKVIVWGLGVEPIWTLLGKLLARYICRASDHFSVRDNESKRLLAQAGVPLGKVKITADPAFLLNPEQPNFSTGETIQNPHIVFCIRHLSDNHPGINLHYLLPVSLRKRLGVGWKPHREREESFVNTLARGVRVCVQEFGAEVSLLPLWPGRDDSVLEAVEKRALELGVHPAAIRRAQVEQTPTKVAEYIRGADLLVSMRLHALIFGAGGDVPLIALSYARKVRGLMRRLGSERWVVEVASRTPPPEELEMKLRHLWQLKGEEQSKLHRAAASLRRQAEADADKIAEVIGD